MSSSPKLESDVFHLVKATEVTAGLAESSGGLLMAYFTCGLTVYLY